MPTTLDYALAYAALGWPVFPLEAGGKRPNGTLAPKGFHNASRNPAIIREWWRLAPDANIGVPCGAPSGFWVLDIDPRNGGDIELQAQLDLLSPEDRANGIHTLVQKTGGGGLHYLFAADDRVRKGKLGQGIDVKRDGGYIVVEPSRTQAGYAFDDWEPFTGELPPVLPAPDWLMALVVAEAAEPVRANMGEPWDADLRKLRSALAVLSADKYLEEWLTVGAALYHGSGGHAGALDLWIEWSRKSAAFEEGACEKKWPTFQKAPATRATLASIFWRASQMGWRWGKPKVVASNPVEKPEVPPGEPPDDVGGEAPPPDDRPSAIRWVAGELPYIVDQAEDALIGSDEGIYRRGSLLVRVVRRESTSVRYFKRAAPGTLSLLSVDKPYLVESLTRAARWERYDKRADDWIRTNAPDIVAATYLSRDGRWKVPRLLGAISAPTLRPDGSVLQTPGYDPDSGTLYDPCGVDYPPIPETPSREDAETALALLRKAFSTFPFEAEVDESVVLSLALTALVRRSLPSAPLGAITAPVMASGKTLIADLIATLATGVVAPAMQYPETDEEAAKIALAVLAAGEPVVLIDNIERPLQGDWLCSILTSEEYTGRLLGVSQMLKVPTCTLWLATGNQLVIAGDLRTRALLCRINPKVERPEQREFRVDIRAWMTTHRARLVVAGLTIIRAYLVHGEGTEVPNWGRFEAWSKLCREPLVWLGCKDPVASLQALEQDDPQRQELLQVITAWRKAVGGDEQTATQIIQQAEHIENSALKEALRGVAQDRGGSISARRLSYWLKRYTDRIVDGKKFTRCRDRDHVAVWRVELIDSTPGAAQ